MAEAPGAISSVAIVSPFPAVRAGLRMLLSGEGMRVTGEASSIAELFGGAAGGAADVVLLDLPAGGVDVLIERLSDLPGLRPLLLGPAPGAEQLGQAIGARPWGYALREASANVLASAVRAVANGLVAVDPVLARQLVQPPLRASDDGGSGEELTAREREVLDLLAAGLANKMIAARLGISEHTVKFHVAAILAKLGAASRTEASYIAARRGLVAL